MPVANYDEIFAGYSQAPGWMSGSQSQVFGAHAEVAVPGLAVGGGGGVVAPRAAAVLIFAGAALAALKLSGIRFNVGM